MKNDIRPRKILKDKDSVKPGVLLVNGPIFDFAAYDLFIKPLGLLYLGSFLEQAGYDVALIDALDRHHPALVERFGPVKSKPNGTGKYHSEIIDHPEPVRHVPRNYRRYGMPADLLEEALAAQWDRHRPVAVCLTSMMTYWYPAVADTIVRIRKIMPGVPIALGGVYASLMPEHARKVCQPDMVFTGSSRTECLGWLDSLSGIHRSNPEKIHGDFADWPCPKYDLYNHLEYLTVMTSLGCPFHCDYCASKVLQPRLQLLDQAVFCEQLQKVLTLINGPSEFFQVALADDALLVNPTVHIIPLLERIARLNLPLRFHCPNGLHARFISPRIAELMYQTGFEMVRLSYESAHEGSLARQASDHKISDRDFAQAVTALEQAGYHRGQLEAYILAGLPGQELNEVQRSAQAVHDLGVRIRLSQYSPIPGTALFDISCRQYGIDPHEPLLHNNSILPALDRRVSIHAFQKFKDRITQFNHSLSGNVR